MIRETLETESYMGRINNDVEVTNVENVTKLTGDTTNVEEGVKLTDEFSRDSSIEPICEVRENIPVEMKKIVPSPSWTVSLETETSAIPIKGDTNPRSMLSKLMFRGKSSNKDPLPKDTLGEGGEERVSPLSTKDGEDDKQ